MGGAKTLCYLVLLCALSGFTPAPNLSKNYFVIDGVRHATYHKLELRSGSKFRLKEKSFKGAWLTKGSWAVSGDTLILSAMTKTMKSGLRKRDQRDFKLVKKYFIVPGGLKAAKSDSTLAFYSGPEWRKRGKPSHVANF